MSYQRGQTDSVQITTCFIKGTQDSIAWTIDPDILKSTYFVTYKADESFRVICQTS